MSHGVLIGPNVEDATVLDKTEYEIALQAVRLARCEEREERSIAYAIHKSAERAPQTQLLGDFLANIMNKFGDAFEEIQGVFVGLYDAPIFLYQENNGAEQVKCINALLHIFCRGGWLAEFLLVHLPVWSERQVTPLQAMWRLSEQASNFESEIESAREMLRQWPQLLQECIPARAQEAKQS